MFDTVDSLNIVIIVDIVDIVDIVIIVVIVETVEINHKKEWPIWKRGVVGRNASIIFIYDSIHSL